MSSSQRGGGPSSTAAWLPAAPADRPFRVGFLLVPSFALLPYAASVEPLRAANRLSGRALFEWLHISPDGRPVQASNGVTILPDRSAGEAAELDILLVCAGTGVEAFDHAPTSAWLRALARRGVALGGISGGPYLLARAGVLNGVRCTIHWDHLPGFAEEFPDLKVTGKLFEIDRGRLTCSGGIAPLDMMHVLVEALHGRKLARAVSDWFVHTELRRGDGPQRMEIGQRLGIRDDKLLRALAEMERRIEAPASRQELAALAEVSVRQLERLFRRRLGRTVGQHYLELRLGRARALLRQTGMPVVEVAVACGFASASHFSRAYREAFGVAPRDERQSLAVTPMSLSGQNPPDNAG